MTADSSKPGKIEEFDIEEYKGWLESMHRSEELGEKRLEFFISFATAVLGAVVLLSEKDKVIDFGLATTLAAWALPALLMLGILTFFRMLRRDSKTDDYKDEIKKIRARFGRDDDDQDHKDGKDEKKKPRRPMINGGLTPVMIAINALLFGLFVGILWRLGHQSDPPGEALRSAKIAGFVGFVFAWAGGVWCKNRSAGREFPWGKPAKPKSSPR